VTGVQPARPVGREGAADGRFRPDVEGLRAVAVVAVVLYHAGFGLVRGGYVGVDVFFVISGFLITRQLLGDLETHGRVRFAAFYARRARRLLPAAALVTVATLVAAWRLLPPLRAQTVAGDALSATFFGINYRLAAQGTDYLAAGAPPSPLQHYWSLSVEEQFYALWPLLLAAASLVWLRRRRRVAGGDGVRTAPVVAVLVGVLAGSLALSVWQTSTAAPYAYFGLQTRAWELATGALVAVALSRTRGVPRRLAAALTWVGLGAVVLSALWYGGWTRFPGYAALLPVLGAALVVLGGETRPRGGAATVLGRSPVQRVGRLSYAWYLWHWPVLLLLPVALGHDLSLLDRLAAVGGSLLLAAGSFALLEDPVRRLRSLAGVPSRGLALGASLSCVSVVASLLAGTAMGNLTGPGAPLASPRPAGRSLVALEASVQAAVRRSLDTTALPSNLRPSLVAASRDNPRVYQDHCHVDAAAVTNPPCVYGDPHAARTVVLLGDSHAAQWFPALDAAARSAHWRLVSWTKSSCPIVDVHMWESTNDQPYVQCDRWRQTTLAQVRAMHPQLVVLSNAVIGTAGVTKDPDDPHVTASTYGSVAAYDHAWAVGTAATVRAARASGAHVAVLTDTPYAGQHGQSVPECVSVHLDSVRDCAFSTTTGLEQPRRRALQTAAARAAGATVVDTLGWLCADDTCPVVVGNLLVYRDEHHLTSTYSSWLAPVVGRALGLLR
jgi:peptidoglycan/LPS O-acetylase OafA/YrhL